MLPLPQAPLSEHAAAHPIYPDSDTRIGTLPALNSFWTVGFTGHRELDSPNFARERIREILRELPDRVAGELVVLSSIARGADLLFIEEVVAASLPWVAILPMPENLFFNHTDFPDSKERQTAETLLKKALTVDITTNPASEEESMSLIWRASAFNDAGFRMIDDADILVAVLRKGELGRGPGGTADIVRYAASRKRPCVLIDPVSGEVEWRDFPARLVDPLMAELLNLTDAASSKIGPTPTTENLARQRFADFFSWIDNAALRKVPLVRNASGVALLLHTAAMVVAAVMLTLISSTDHLVIYATWLKAGLVGLGFSALVWVTFFKPQLTAARYRLAAECCRAVLATWEFPRPLVALFRTPASEFRHFCKSVIFYRLVSQTSHGGAGRLFPVELADLERFRSEYLARRVREQLAYYRQKRHSAHPKSHLSELLAFAFSAIALVCTLWLAFTVERASHDTVHHASHAWLHFGMVAAPVLASLFVALNPVYEWKRRVARYTEIIAVLEDAEHKIAHTADRETLERIVVDTERELMAENVEWYCMARMASSV